MNCIECGEQYPEFGDGFEALCGNCADRAEAQRIGRLVHSVLDDCADMNMSAQTILNAREVLRELDPENEPPARPAYRIAAEMWEEQHQRHVFLEEADE